MADLFWPPRGNSHGEYALNTHILPEKAQSADTRPDLGPIVGDFDPKDLLALIEKFLDEDKAEAIITIDLAGKSEIADAMVVASGRSQRHVGALATKLAHEIKQAGMGNVSIEGMPACDWVLIDAKDVIVHLFRPEVREFYNLERIWAPENAPAPKTAGAS